MEIQDHQEYLETLDLLETLDQLVRKGSKVALAHREILAYLVTLELKDLLVIPVHKDSRELPDQKAQ